MAGGFVSAVTNFLSAATNGKTIPVSPNNPLPVAVVSGGGGGGGGGAVTVADGADVAQGTTTNAAYADTTGVAATTVIGGLKGLFVALAAMSAKLPTSLGIKTSAASFSVAPASDAVFSTTLTSGTALALTGTQLTNGTAIALPNANGVQIQFANLSADNLTVTHSLDGTNYVPATLLKHDLSQTTMSAATGTTQNGIYSVMVFGGYLKVLKGGTADTTFAATMRTTS